MSTQVTRPLPNWITFPQQLRDAIPDWLPCAGRVLQLDSVDAGPSDSEWVGRRVAVKLRVCETGNLEGVFELSISLNGSAARALGETLCRAAGQAAEIPH